MSYEISWDPKAEKQLEKLPKEISRRIVLKLRYVAIDGRGIEALKEAEYGYKIRIGDYRIIIDLTYNPDIIWLEL